jgi:hypothetical protein
MYKKEKERRLGPEPGELAVGASPSSEERGLDIHHSQTSRAKPMSPSELRHIGGEDVHVRRHLHVLDPCHRRYMAQAAAERRPHNGDLRCERKKRGSLQDDKSSVAYSSNTAVKIGHTPERRRGDVTHPELEGGGSPAIQ